MPVPTKEQWHFGPFHLDVHAGELYKHGIKLKLQGHPIQILALLLERPGELITREEIQQTLWPSENETFVDFEHGLNTSVRKLRQALGDEAETPKYIETLPRRGYRFIGVISETPPETEFPAASQPLTDRRVHREASTYSRVLAKWRGRHWLTVAAVVALMAAASIFIALAVRTVGHGANPRAAELTLEPLTALPGNVTSVSFSPDGSEIALAWDRGAAGRGYDVFIKVMGSDTLLQITNDPARSVAVAWSPDGRHIAFSRADGGEPGIFLVAPTGGRARKLTGFDFSDNRTDVSWSADGKLIAFTDHPPKAAWERAMGLFTIAVDTGERKEIPTGCSLVSAAAFAPHSQELAWVCVDSWSRFSLHVSRLSDGSHKKLVEGADGIGGIAWSHDGSRIIFSSPLDYGDLKEVAVERPGEVKKLPIGHEASKIAVDPAHDRLAYVEGILNFDIWRVDLSQPKPEAHPLITSSRQEKAPNISPDGTRIAFESTRSGSNELWVSDADGGRAMQLSNFGIRATGSPRWSPDGARIVFDSRASGDARIYLVAPGDEVIQELPVRNLRGNNQPCWSHDGQWIYFVHAEDEHNPSIWKVPVTGGDAVEVAAAPASYPVESPDGKYLYFVREWRLWRSLPDGSAAELVKAMPRLKLLGDKWVPYGNGIYYMADDGGHVRLNFLDLASGKTRSIGTLPGSPPLWMGQMSIASDGKWLVYPQVDQQASNLMVIENWK